MELPLQAIRVFHGSTTYVREGWGSYHSRSTVMGGNAVLLAAAELKAQILSAGASLLQCSAGDVRYEAGRVIAQHGGSAGLTELASAGITFEATFHNSKHTYTYGSHVAHVAVDAETGHIEIVDYVAMEDAGRIINPLTLHGQAIGSIVQGLGGALLEEFTYSDGGDPLAVTFADYLMPTAKEMPRVETMLSEDAPSPLNPSGFKGAGEGGITPVGAAIASAIDDALQQQGAITQLPITPQRLMALMKKIRR